MWSNHRIYVVDDDDAVRDSLIFLLDSAGFRAHAFESPLHLLGQLEEIEQGCVITDIRMPGMNGLDLVRALSEKRANLPVIVITGHADVPLAVEAMKAGVSDFIEKPFADDTILAAIRTALAKAADVPAQDAVRQAILARTAVLSTRESQVLQGLVAGHPNKVIAHNLGISPRTVEIYRANVMTKMEAKSLSELVRMALIAEL